MKKILVTCALPYSNGPIHLGHLLEHIQADIWVKYQKMEKNIVYFICCDDAHGTAIMLKSQQTKKKPEIIINNFYLQHINDFKKFYIEHDFYHTTHSQINLKYVNKFYDILNKNNYIEQLRIQQFYDIRINMFLPDRFIVGDCPKCKAHNQYGDVCEICGAIYNSWELIKPISKLSKTIPVLKETTNYFFKLYMMRNKLYSWINDNVIIHKVKNKVIEWLDKGINSWNISRDYPYFGFKLPNTFDKFFYVWFDALIGYLSTFKYFCRQHNKENIVNRLNFKDFWHKNSSTYLYQFIGKDIIYFHTIIWPAILDVLNLRKPTKIFVHGHLKLDGCKMSKSKNNFITAKQWSNEFDSDSLRFYFANKISGLKIDDININKQDFLKKINSDLVNKIVNLASRSAKFINCYFNNNLSNNLINKELYNHILNRTKIIRRYAVDCNIKTLIYEVISLSEIANQSFDQYKPWTLNLNIYTQRLLLQDISTLFINIFRILITCIKPIVPNLSNKTEHFLNTNLTWDNLKTPLLNHKIKIYKKLYSKIYITNSYIF